MGIIEGIGILAVAITIIFIVLIIALVVKAMRTKTYTDSVSVSIGDDEDEDFDIDLRLEEQKLPLYNPFIDPDPYSKFIEYQQDDESFEVDSARRGTRLYKTPERRTVTVNGVTMESPFVSDQRQLTI